MTKREDDHEEGMMHTGGTARILVLDANRAVLAHYRRLLEAEGYGVEIGTFLETSAAEIERLHPNLLLFDLLVDAIQERHVWHLIRQIKEEASLASLPLLICTSAFLLPDFLLYVQRQRHLAVLFKPLDHEQFLHQIRSLLATG